MKEIGNEWNRIGSLSNRSSERNGAPDSCSWGRVNGINLYRHGIARMYLNLDDSGQCYVSREHWKFERAEFASELTKLEAALAQLGENMESVYDEAYIAQKRDALLKAGIPLERIEIQPEDLSIN